MLRSLYIENIAVAREIDITWNDGFSVLTGETGAGKSVMIDSLEMLAGGKIGREVIRSGEEKATVTGLFEVTDSRGAEVLRDLGYPPDENGELLVTRTLTADGRSTCKVNRRAISLSVLREVGEVLLSIQSQNARSDIYRKSEYIRMLDEFADVSGKLEAYRDRYEALLRKKNEIEELKKELADRNMMLDILKYQQKEIDGAKLNTPDEDERLIKLRTKIKGYERITKCANLTYKALVYNEKGATATYLIDRAIAAVNQLSDVYEDADETVQKLESYKYELMDIGERIHDIISDDMPEDPERQLNAIESRLSQIDRLKRKYGSTIEEIRTFREGLVKKIDDLESGELRISELEREYEDIKKEALALALEMSEIRCDVAAKLSGDIAESLRFLDMPKVKFSIAVTRPRDKNGGYTPGPDGMDDVDFLIATNPGEPMQSLGKIASGGESSRVMLALLVSLTGKKGSGTIVFDEIDTGVSGSTSERIGILLKKLSEKIQVISVTHSPQIASLADTHYLIKKHEAGGRAESTVTEIEGDARTAEIARIIGGISVTEKQMETAREMLGKDGKNP